MKQLLDAFLQLPTWQGILLIVAAVGFVTLICIWVSWLSYRAGRLDSVVGSFEK